MATRIYPVGAEMVSAAEAHVRVWAPDHRVVTLVIDSRTVTLDAEDGGYHGCQVVARPGSRYGFRFEGDDKVYPDPASRSQPDGPHGLSAVVNLTAHAWQDGAWAGVSLPGQVLYEFHIGTFTAAGTWRAAAEQLPRLRDAGITVLQMMPVAEFDGAFGWGYDGVQWFAPYHGYGTPADLQHFVDTAHGLGLAVILDVVYNHLGPSGNYLPRFSKWYGSSRYANEWGEALNFDDQHCEGMRELVLANVAYWVREFHVDGYRIDAAQQIYDASPEHLLAAMTRVARETAAPRSVIVVAEHEPQHAKLMRSPDAGGYGMDGVFNEDFHHSSRVALTGTHEAYTSDYRGTSREWLAAALHGFLFQGRSYPWQSGRRGAPALDCPPYQFIAFLENHDQVANAAIGRRLIDIASAPAWRAMSALLLLGPWTPLIFQGQEWGTRTPFSYFCDHEPELQGLVFQGRQAFLGQFTRLREAYEGATIDAVGRPAFEAGRLDHAFDAHADPVWRMYRDLTTLRREDASLGQHAVRLTGSTLDDQTLLLRFIGRVAHEDRLLIVNLGSDFDVACAPDPLIAPPELFEWSVLWSSEDRAYGGVGIAGNCQPMKLVATGRATTVFPAIPGTLMTNRPLLDLKAEPRRDPAAEAALEWILANGLGGYASGSVDGPPMRRFHGWLIAALPAPLGRALLLHALHEVVDVEGGSPQALTPGRDDNPPVVAGRDFCLQAGLPHWTFNLGGGVRVERTAFVPHGQNTVHLRYRLVGGSASARLQIRPWLDFRPHEGLVTPGQHLAYTVTPISTTRVEFTRAESPLRLQMQVLGDDATFEADPEEWAAIPLAIERERGYDHITSAHGPGIFSLTLSPGRDAWLTATTEPWAHLDAAAPDQALEHELTRRQRLLASSDESLQQPDTFLLPLAADQFIVRPATRAVDDAQAYAVGAEPRTVIAGYPWFTDWGRDTMISLEGLALVTGRHSEAHDILRTFALHVRHGLIPNLFPEGQREGLYHTADATLWFFHALHRYDTVTGDHALIEELLPVLQEIVRCHRQGTLFNIHVDTDGLLAQGASGVQLTWMDALVDGWVVTPRRGKAVEINALWHNALVLLASWLDRAGLTAERDELRAEASRCRVAFNARFWNPVTKRLNDVVDGENGDDDACRPNQILAIAVPNSPLDRQYWPAVLDSVTRELATPAGLRTLSPQHPDYKRAYFGDLRARDAAYHQGTVWPWLMGPFVDAWLAVHPEDAAGARRWIEPLLDHVVNGGCVGSVSEIFDADTPFTPRGCFAQAWSVAELARLVAKLAACEVPVRQKAASEVG